MTENKPSEETNELKDLVVEKEFNQTLDDLLANPFGSDGETAANIVNSETDAAPRLVDMLTETNKKQALELSKQIEPGNQSAILGYGAPAQAKLHDFSHS
ncbi:toxic anion resistance protein, partial [Listeria monocytogenes]